MRKRRPLGIHTRGHWKGPRAVSAERQPWLQAGDGRGPDPGPERHTSISQHVFLKITGKILSKNKTQGTVVKYIWLSLYSVVVGVS